MPARTRSRTPLLIGVVIAVVAIAALVAVLASGDDSKAEPTPVDENGGVVEVLGDALPPLTDPRNDQALGMPAPALRGTDYQGEPITIDPTSSGRPTLVVFLAHWCPHCNAEVPRLTAWRDSGEIPDNLDIVGVSTRVDSAAPNYPPSNWLEEKDWQWPVLADDFGDPNRQMPPTAVIAYGVSGFPFFVLTDADGNVVARQSGEVPIDVLAQLVASVV